MQLSYKYQAFGFIISCNFACPQLIESDEIPTISFIKQQYPLWDISQNHFTKGNSTFFEINIKNTVQFRIENASCIRLFAPETTSIQTIQLYLLGSAMGALLHQVGHIPLHGAVLNINGNGVLFSGESGAGKSTLAALLMQKGHPLVTDDVAATIINDTGIKVFSSYPHAKWWHNTISMLHFNNSNTIELEAEPGKYSIPLLANFQTQAIGLKLIFVLSVHNTISSVKCDEIKGVSKFGIIKQNIYRPTFLEQIVSKNAIFEFVSKIARETKVYSISRPQNRDSVYEIISLINKLVEKIR